MRPDRVIDAAASFWVAPDLAALYRDPAPPYVCAAFHYPLTWGPGIASTIRRTNEASFATLLDGGTSQIPAHGAMRHVLFFYEDATALVTFTPGYWVNTAQATAELVMSVRVLDRHGDEIMSTLVSGEGSANGTGGCRVGASLLSEAAEKAMRRAMEEYVHKVINSGAVAIGAVASDAP